MFLQRVLFSHSFIHSLIVKPGEGEAESAFARGTRWTLSRQLAHRVVGWHCPEELSFGVQGQRILGTRRYRHSVGKLLVTPGGKAAIIASNSAQRQEFIPALKMGRGHREGQHGWQDSGFL